jgi:hypothetical protein
MAAMVCKNLRPTIKTFAPVVVDGLGNLGRGEDAS